MTTLASPRILSNACQLVTPFGASHPDVRRVHAAENFQPGFLRALAQNFRVAEIMFDERAHLRFALRRIERLGAALDDVAHAVELRRHAPRPERMQRLELAGLRLRVERFRHDGERAARAGEAAVLREAAELDGALARAGNFVNRMRQRRVGDVGLVGRVEQDDGLVFERVFHPRLELRRVAAAPVGLFGEQR